jgi:hypothetical protein
MLWQYGRQILIIEGKEMSINKKINTAVYTVLLIIIFSQNKVLAFFNVKGAYGLRLPIDDLVTQIYGSTLHFVYITGEFGKWNFPIFGILTFGSTSAQGQPLTFGYEYTNTDINSYLTEYDFEFGLGYKFAHSFPTKLPSIIPYGGIGLIVSIVEEKLDGTVDDTFVSKTYKTNGVGFVLSGGFNLPLFEIFYDYGGFYMEIELSYLQISPEYGGSRNIGGVTIKIGILYGG